jgi:hypothetical protein
VRLQKDERERRNHFLKIQREYISLLYTKKKIAEDTRQLRIKEEGIYQNMEGEVEKHIHLLDREKRR